DAPRRPGAERHGSWHDRAAQRGGVLRGAGRDDQLGVWGDNPSGEYVPTAGESRWRDAVGRPATRLARLAALDVAGLRARPALAPVAKTGGRPRTELQRTFNGRRSGSDPGQRDPGQRVSGRDGADRGRPAPGGRARTSPQPGRVTSRRGVTPDAPRGHDADV